MPENPTSLDSPLGFLEKARVLTACGISILLLWTIGWQVAHPTDPEMALTLSRGGASVLAVWPTLAVLAAISAAIGTAIMGRRLPEAGVLAAAVGLAVMSLRGGTMQVLLGYSADTQPAMRRALMMSLAVDCVLWAGIMAIAWLTMIVVRRWLWGDEAGVAQELTPVAVKPAAKSADKASDAAKSAPSSSKKQAAGYGALAVTVVISLVVIWNSISRTPVAMVERNQVIASVAGGLFLGAMAARYFTGATESLWYVLAAPIVGLVGYVLGHFSSDMSWAQGTIYQPYAMLSTTPPHDLARPLPVIYVTVGVAGALCGFWTADRMERLAQQESE